jgi:hypothetical protein
MKKQHFMILLVVYVLAVFYLAATTPISPHEAKIYYTSHTIVATLMHWGETLFFFSPALKMLGLRIFFLLFGFISLALFYRLSKNYFHKQHDVMLATVIFMLLPGIVTGMILANVSIIVLTLVLLFVLLYEHRSLFSEIALALIMFALFFIHEAASIFYIALLLYAWHIRDRKLFVISLAFLIASLLLSRGITIEGRPSGHFLEIFGLYAAVFSPLLFLYFFYAMYRILLREEKNIIWYISFTALAISLLLSLRQKVYITDFAPYVMISVILMLQVLNHSVRVRLPKFQRYYRLGFYIVMGNLVFSFLMILFHRPLFYLLDDPSKHFAYRMYQPYLRAKALRGKGLECYKDAKGRERYQLRFYGIHDCNK